MFFEYLKQLEYFWVMSVGDTEHLTKYLNSDISFTEAIWSVCVKINFRRTFSLACVQSLDNNTHSFIPLCLEPIHTSIVNSIGQLAWRLNLKRKILQIWSSTSAKHEYISGTTKWALIAVIQWAAIEFSVTFMFGSDSYTVLLQIDEFVPQFELQWPEILRSQYTLVEVPLKQIGRH